MDNKKFQELVLQQLNMLTTDIKGIKSTVSKLEVDIENKVIEKIRALFDDREVQNERLDRIEDKLDKISTDTSYLVARVARLENLAKQPRNNENESIADDY